MSETIIQPISPKVVSDKEKRSLLDAVVEMAEKDFTEAEQQPNEEQTATVFYEVPGYLVVVVKQGEDENPTTRFH